MFPYKTEIFFIFIMRGRGVKRALKGETIKTLKNDFWQSVTVSDNSLISTPESKFETFNTKSFGSKVLLTV